MGGFCEVCGRACLGFFERLPLDEAERAVGPVAHTGPVVCRSCYNAAQDEHDRDRERGT